MDELTKAFTEIMVKIDPKTFYQEVFKKSMGRANIEYQDIVAHPPANSKLAKNLGTQSKSARAQRMRSEPFKAGATMVNKATAKMHGEMGIGHADYLYIDEIKPVDKIVKESVEAELMAEADQWMKTVVLDAIKKGNLTQKLSVSRESGT